MASASPLYLNPPWANLSPLNARVVKFDARRGQSVAKRALNPSISMLGHSVTTVTFVGLVIAYVVVVLFLYFTRPYHEEFMQVPSSEVPPIVLHLRISCTNPPFCGSVSVTINYTDAPHCAPLLDSNLTGQLETVHQLGTLMPPQREVAINVPLCHTPDALFSTNTAMPLRIPGVFVDFTAINPGVLRNGTHELSAKERQAQALVSVIAVNQLTNELDENAMRRDLTVDTWQVKTLVVGQTVRMTDGVIASQEPRALGVQYEGGRPSWRATLIISLAPFANVFDTKRPGSLPGTIGSIGGAWAFLGTVFVVLSPIWTALFPAKLETSHQYQQR